MNRVKLKLGAVSISLAVKDLAASRAFYQKLGFGQIAGNQAQKWLILPNGDTTSGLFQGMFERNTLTFNPGWTSKGEPLNDFHDVREIQRSLKGNGVTLITEADESTTGPARIMMSIPMETRFSSTSTRTAQRT
jgi:lactoylglutathione lyase